MSNEKRDPEGQPTGGQYAVNAKGEAVGVNLTPSAPRKTSIGITAVVELDHYGVEPLPAWPVDLPKPSTSYSWDEDSNLETIIQFGGDVLTIWGPSDNACDSFTELPDEMPDITTEQQAQVAAYGYQMHANLVSLTGQVEYAAHTPSVRNHIESIAAGNGPADPTDDPQDPAWRSPAQRGAARAEASLKAWFGEQVHESTWKDVMADLLHYANAKGLDSGVIYEAMNDGQTMFLDELANPEG